MTKKIVCIFLIIMILSVSIVSFAVTQGELQNKVNELNTQIDQTENRIDEINGEVDAVTKEINNLSAEIEEKEDQIAVLNQELKTLNDEISKLEAELKDEEEKYNDRYDKFCKRIVAQYKSGKVSYLDVLLNAKSLSEFVSKYYYLEKIADLDTKILNDIEERKNQIENNKKTLDEKKSELTDKQTQLKREEINLSNKKANKNKYVSQLTAEQQEQQRQLDELNEQKRQTNNEIAELAIQNGNKGGGYVYSGGILTFPAPNYTRISSGFGYRGSAATGGVGSSNHKGMDLAAPSGSPIVAAESGVVIKVVTGCTHNYPKTYSTRCSCGGGYGNYLMISHGGNLVTLYGHCSTISVSTGQTVTAGQQIATVGCTGYSTGNHLHFGVLLNGTYVNPASYLGK